jgi:hypothetical protein
MSYRILSRDEHFEPTSPKRILALDGGGLRGILALGFLGRIEALLRERHGDDPGFRLCHYFDLIAGTSTGAIIAAALAKGMSVAEVVTQYMSMGETVFKRSRWRKGVLFARYEEKKLVRQLKKVLGDITLGDKSLRTGLLVMTKRIDTGSSWPLGNNPAGRYFGAGDSPATIPNADYPLWKVVRASTAAPSFFDPEKIRIAGGPGLKTVTGQFVDGGVSPFNNPSLQALMYATLDGFRVGWETGAEKLLLVSVGTGSGDVGQEPTWIAAKGAVKALLSLMDDCADLVETVMQWLSSSPRARVIDGEIGDLGKDLLGSKPLLSYLRYNVALTRDGVDPLMPELSDERIATLGAMDEPKNLDTLRKLGELAAEREVTTEDFAPGFDLQP